MTKRRCSNCVFWDEVDPYQHERTGRCRIHPPRYDGQQGGLWPFTSATDWCGQFRSQATDGAQLLTDLDVDDA